MDHIKAIVSSRPEQPFLDRFSFSKSLRMQDVNEVDIKKYVSGTLLEEDLMLSYEDSEPDNVFGLIHSVVYKADGVFLWARLAVRELLKGLLRKNSLRKLGSRVEELSNTLDDLFAQLLANIDLVDRPSAANFVKLVAKWRLPYEHQTTILEMAVSCDSKLASKLQKLMFVDQEAHAVERAVVECSQSLREFGTKLGSECAGLLDVNMSRHELTRGLPCDNTETSSLSGIGQLCYQFQKLTSQAESGADWTNQSFMPKCLYEFFYSASQTSLEEFFWRYSSRKNGFINAEKLESAYHWFTTYLGHVSRAEKQRCVTLNAGRYYNINGLLLHLQLLNLLPASCVLPDMNTQYQEPPISMEQVGEIEDLKLSYLFEATIFAIESLCLRGGSIYEDDNEQQQGETNSTNSIRNELQYGLELIRSFLQLGLDPNAGAERLCILAEEYRYTFGEQYPRTNWQRYLECVERMGYQHERLDCIKEIYGHALDLAGFFLERGADYNASLVFESEFGMRIGGLFYSINFEISAFGFIDGCTAIVRHPNQTLSLAFRKRNAAKAFIIYQIEGYNSSKTMRLTVSTEEQQLKLIHCALRLRCGKPSDHEHNKQFDEREQARREIRKAIADRVVTDNRIVFTRSD
ncbi:MAG: hypothetical protein M1820_004356 [Bogoriella megaspora]|nr:MAG: hypothetical protein M1820_004356 [Bogoriella megaspora]